MNCNFALDLLDTTGAVSLEARAAAVEVLKRWAGDRPYIRRNLPGEDALARRVFALSLAQQGMTRREAVKALVARSKVTTIRGCVPISESTAYADLATIPIFAC